MSKVSKCLKSCIVICSRNLLYVVNSFVFSYLHWFHSGKDSSGSSWKLKAYETRKKERPWGSSLFDDVEWLFTTRL